MQRAGRVRLSENTVKLHGNERNIVGYYMLRVDASCCAKFETCQIFEPTTPNISDVP